jgi:hypothetical protein
MTVPTEFVLILFCVLFVVGIVLSFEIAALLGALSVVAIGVWARRRSAGSCPRCGATIKGPEAVCKRCGYEA